MMQMLRERVGKWVVRIIMVLLILGFAAWDLSGYMTGRIGNPFEVAAVRAGDVSVSLRDVEVAFVDSIAGRISLSDAIEAGELDQLLEEMRLEVLMDAEAQARTLAPAPDTVAEMILADPRFRDEQGTFNGEALRAYLQQQRISEATFLRQESRRMGQAQVQLITLATPLVPDAIAKRVAVYQQEARDAELIRLAPDPALDDLQPEDGALEAFHEARAALYRAPAQRVFTVLRLTRDNVLDRIAVSDDVLKRRYDRQREDLRLPATRDVDQWLFDSQDQADVAMAALDAGTPFEDLGTATGAAEAFMVSLSDLAQDGLPPGLNSEPEVVFEAEVGDVLGPYPSELGFHVVRISARAASRIPPFEEVKEQLRDAYRQEEVDDRLLDLVDAIEDGLGAGDPLSKVAEDLDLELLTTPPVDQSGQTPPGQFLPLPLSSERVRTLILQEGFALTPDAPDSGLKAQADGGGIWIHLDDIQEPRVLSFEEARTQVLQDWRDDKREIDLAERARRVGQALELGQSAQQAATLDSHATVETVAAVLRDGRQAGPLSPSLVGPLFEAELRDVVTSVTPAGAQLARLTAITRPQLDTVEPGALKQQLEGITNAALNAALFKELAERHQVSVNREAVIQYLTEESEMARFAR